MLYKLKYQRVIIIQQTLINADFNLYTFFVISCVSNIIDIDAVSGTKT